MQSPKLCECLRQNVQPDRSMSKATTIRMGSGEENYAPQFHYLYAFISEFDDANLWESFPYEEGDAKIMQAAINNIRSQQIYRNGKHFVLSNPNTTKDKIKSSMETILQNAGKGDFVLLYLSSHGEKDAEGKFQLILKDSYFDADKGQYANTLSKDEINHYVNQLTQKQAKVVFFLDACYAGAVLDDDIRGEAAYYLSTNGSNPAYYNRLLGSPFAIALMEVMTGSLNGVDNHCFKDSMVQVGSLGNYLSNAVFAKSSQRPMTDEHEFSPSYVLWKINGAPKENSAKESASHRRLERLANNESYSRDERAEAMLELGDRYYKGIGVEIDFDKAFDWYSKAEEILPRKDLRAKALFMLSECFYYGNPEQDSVYAYKYAHEAAKLGHLEASYLEGWYLFNGYGTTENKKEGMALIKKAAQRGNARAQRYLGTCYEEGWSVPQDFKKAHKWYLKSAEQGNVQAQLYLGTNYFIGYKEEQDDNKAFFWLSKAAEQGDVEAQYWLGNCYLWGKGTPINKSLAMEWIIKAAEQNNVIAQNSLGDMYYLGDGVEQSYEKAAQWYKRAADQGDANSKLKCAKILLRGEGVPQDSKEGIKRMKELAEQENVEAQLLLGHYYQIGKYVSPDTLEAFKWYSKAAKQGDDMAQLSLGHYYFFGQGVEADYEKAAYWLTKSAEQNNAIAQHGIGLLYYSGIGVPKDYAKAAQYYERSMKLGYNPSRYDLGYCYYYGQGVPQDKSKAFELIRLAAEQGEEKAVKFLQNHHE